MVVQARADTPQCVEVASGFVEQGNWQSVQTKELRDGTQAFGVPIQALQNGTGW